jgi:hypothetical protein
MALKPSDYQTVPLCSICHTEIQTKQGRSIKGFKKKIIELLSEYIERELDIA